MVAIERSVGQKLKNLFKDSFLLTDWAYGKPGRGTGISVVQRRGAQMFAE